MGRRSDWAESENPWLAGGGSRVLQVDDLVSVTSIQIDSNRDNLYSTTLTTTDYELAPRNALLGPERWPYTQIEMTEWGTQWAWLPGCRVKVTGVWGWPAVPSPVVRGCIELTRILRMESPRATNRFTDMGDVVTSSREARNIIDDLTSAYGKVTL